VSSSEKNLTQALFEAAIALGRTRDAEGVARVAVEEIQRASGVEAVALYLLDANQDLLVLREYAGTTSAFRDQMTRMPIREARVAEQAVREGRIVTLPVAEHPSSTLRSLYAGQGFRHLTVVPVAGGEQPLGVLQMASRQESPLTEEDRPLVQAIAGLVGVALENARLREQMLLQQERLRALAKGTLRAREEEARRIAHELHDESGQLLASVHIALDGLTQRFPEGEETARRLHALLDRVEQQLRRLSRELRPTILDDLGLTPAVEWLAQGVSERTGVSVSVRAAIDRLPALVETALYRVIQEALNNAARHASASAILVDVHATGSVVEATVTDDGRGFDAGAALSRRGNRGLGLIGIRERVEALGGRICVASEPGSGTRLAVTIPLREAE
jgi:signal transduction histidine kinase